LRGHGVCFVVMDGQLDAVDLLGAAAPYLVPQRVVEVASMKAGCPVAAYVLDLEGLFALRLAGDVERFPARIRTRLASGRRSFRRLCLGCGGWWRTASGRARCGRCRSGTG
jgi:hypothetical protein